MTDDQVTVLDSDTCWEVIARNELGRLAYNRGGRIHMAPVNYAVDGDRVLFKTAQGSKLAGVLGNEDVAFEVDEIRDSDAYSIILRGRARELSHDEAIWADQLRLRPWVPSPKQHVVAIEVTELSGRSFSVHRPWTHMMISRQV